MATEIDAVPRDFVYGICQWGVGTNLERWASKIGNNWRMSNDITNAWHSIFRITNQVVPLARYSKPGGYNDMDMLMVGNGVLTPEESRTHFAIWAMEKSPLFVGAALENHLLDADALTIFSNKEVVAINQDPLGRAAELVRRFSEEEYDVWAGPLAGDGMVVAVINWGAAERNITVKLPDVGIQSAKKARDVWAATDLGGLDTTYFALIPSHGVKLLRLEGLTKAGEYTGKIA
jgi:alpha-galactosidase